MLSPKDADTLVDLCARNGIEEMLSYLAIPTGENGPTKANKACAIAVKLVSKLTGKTRVQLVEDL